MIVKSMEFEPGDEGVGIRPVSVVAEFSIRELALITRMVGDTNFHERNVVQHDGGLVGSNLYDDLTGGVFNPFWDDGILDVPR